MHKYFRETVLLSIVLLLTLPAAAQETFIGFKGGVSIPRLSGGGQNDLTRDYKSRTSTDFGVFVEKKLAKRVFVQIEADLAGHGGIRTGIQPITQPLPGLPALPPGTYFYANFRNKAVLNYLEVPGLVKYRFGDDKGARLYLNGGGFYGRLLSAHQITSGSSTIYADSAGHPLLLPPNFQPLPAIPFDANTNIKKDLKANNFGVAGGGGIEIPMGRNYFLIDGRISYGLIAIQRNTVLNGSSHTGNLVIAVGYAFGLK